MTSGNNIGEQGHVSAAESRTIYIATEAGEKAVSEIAEFLARHEDLIDASTLTAIKDREFQVAFEAAKRAREEGRNNDQYGNATGLTLYLTKQGAEGFTKLGERTKEEAPYIADYASQLQPANQEETLFALRLPNGYYSMGFGGCSIWGETSAENLHQRENAFSLGYSRVARIEGDLGELWQNVNLTPDGTMRAKG